MSKPRAFALIPFFCAIAVALTLAQNGPVTDSPVAGATNFRRLDANTASAGQTTPEAFAAIKQLGFRTVINLRTSGEQGADIESEGEAVTKLGMGYVSLPFSPAAPDVAAVEKFLQTVKDPSAQPVFVHCASGQRANAFWLIKRVLQDGWTTEKALAEADGLKMDNERLRKFALAYIEDHGK